MSKEEKFLRKWFPTITLKDKHDREMPLISWESCEEIMDAFFKQEFKSRVKAISDDDIENDSADYDTRSYYGHFAGEEPKYHYSNGMNNYKNKLLKKIEQS